MEFYFLSRSLHVEHFVTIWAHAVHYRYCAGSCVRDVRPFGLGAKPSHSHGECRRSQTPKCQATTQLTTVAVEEIKPFCKHSGFETSHCGRQLVEKKKTSTAHRSPVSDFVASWKNDRLKWATNFMAKSISQRYPFPTRNRYTVHIFVQT